MSDAHKNGQPAGAQSGAHDITERERDFIRHALGLSKQKTGFRNYYCAGGDDVEVGRSLVRKGMAVEARPNSVFPDPIFYISTAGFNAVRRRGERMDNDECARLARIDAGIARAAASARGAPALSAAPAEAARAAGEERQP